ncbi:GspH/FimT family pseudopilin [Pseudomonas stutzeri]|nr:GspH/FimT family pseudopilin [Stutzerimonas stutzeri]
MPRKISPSRGFTLIELMVTLGVLAILLALAVPAFNDMIRRQRMHSASTEWLSLAAQARSEAIRRGHPIRIVAAGSGFRMLDASTGEVLREWQQRSVETELKNFAGLLFLPPLGILNVAQACVQLKHRGVDGHQRFVYLGRSGMNLVFAPERGAVPEKVTNTCTS